jgi:hypothetical protein
MSVRMAASSHGRAPLRNYLAENCGPAPARSASGRRRPNLEDEAMVSMTDAGDAPRRGGANMTAFHVGGGLDLLLGADLLLFGGWVADKLLVDQAEVLGMEPATVIRIVGALLLAVGAETLLLARSTGRLRRLLPAIVWLNWAWVAASALLLAVAGSAFSGLGVAAVGAVAIVVAALAVAQGRALARA